MIPAWLHFDASAAPEEAEVRHRIADLGVRASAPALVLVALSACASDLQHDAVQMRDSAGTSIVESSAPRLDDEHMWTLDSVPLFALDGTLPAYAFSQVTDATRRRDGSLVVLDGASLEVRAFDAKGAFLGATGQDGDGPGDFRHLTSLSPFLGDSLLVYDESAGRATILDADLGLGRVVSLEGGLQVADLTLFGSSALLGKAWDFDTFIATEGPYRAQYLLVRFTLDGDIRDTIGTLPAWNGYKINREGGGYVDVAALFAMDGQVVVRGDTAILGAGDRMEFERVSAGGKLLQIVRAPVLEGALGAKEIAAERAGMLGPTPSARLRDVVAQLPAPEMRPAYDEIEVDPEGFVWVARYRSRRVGRDDPITWYVFAPDGSWTGSLTTPARFEVLEIGSDYMLGSRRDSLDVEQIQLLRLLR